MFLTRISVTHPVFATMMMVTLVVFGLFAFPRLGLDQYPNVDVPVVVVITAYPGATPEAVETEVTKPIEEAINRVGGLDQITSTSYEGRSVVVAKFRLTVAGPVAMQEIRDKIAPLETAFPSTVMKPVVSRSNPADQPILSIAISAPQLDSGELTALTEQRIIRQLTTVSGVGAATLVGGQTRQVEITIDETRMRALGIGIDEVLSALRNGNQNRSAGNLVTGFTDLGIQVRGRIDQPADFLEMIVARRGGGPVYLRDVASVADGVADAESLAIYNGQPALAIDIVKVQDANTVQVVDDVTARLAQLNAELAADGIQLSVVTDASTPIRDSVAQVQSTLIEGASLAVAIVFLFLNSWRSTVITGLTLPIAMVGTLAVISALGFTLNTMSLLALTLSIGILVDDAIVVRENITRHLHMGKSHFQAALDGTNEIGLAVLATTGSIVAVFVPVAFMGGIVGRFFYEFGVTVSAAVLISLFVAFTLDPMLSSIWYDPDAQPDAKRGPIGWLIALGDQGFDWLAGGYRHLIRWTLNRRLVTLLATLGIFIGSIFMVPMVGVEFTPTADEGRFQINMQAPAGSSLDYTAAKVRQIEDALREFQEVDMLYSTVNTGTSPGKQSAAILVGLVPQAERQRTPVMLADPVRARLAAIPGIDISILQQGLGGGDSAIQLSILGDDQAQLDQITADLTARMRQIPGLVDIVSSADAASNLIAVRLRPEAASDLGIGIAQIGAALAALIGGEEVGSWTNALGETHAVVVRLPAAARSDIAEFGDLTLTTSQTDASGAPAMVQLNQVAEFAQVKTASEIHRLGMTREVQITADISGRVLGDVTADLQALIAASPLPAGYQIDFGGDSATMLETVGFMISALLMAVTFIYIVLASQFGSFLQPLAIMTALPLSLIGVVLGLLASGSTINMFSLIGFIMLMGLVTKNGILLVDFANREHQRGLPLTEAMINAGAIRFRPIVMTTLAMIFGMIPLALAVSGGGAQRAPMAHAVIGGLISTTVLTLIVVPVILSYIDSFSTWAARFLTVAPEHHLALATPQEE